MHLCSSCEHTTTAYFLPTPDSWESAYDDAGNRRGAPPSLDDIMAEVQRLEEQGKLVEASTLMVAHLRMQGAKQNAGGAAAVE